MQLEATGKSVELAIQNGLLECGMRREDVQVKVLDAGGLFKKAKVLLTWAEEDAEPLVQGKEIEDMGLKNNTEQEEYDDRLNTTEEKENTQNETHSEIKEKKKRIVNTDRLEKRGIEFLTGLARKLDEKATVESQAGENEISFSIKGENVGKLIGFHGENLQALQMLLSGLKLKSEGPVRMYLDVDGYKQNRNQAIIDLANKTAEQAVKIERNIHLDPMNAYDRRIVHTTLQNRDDVTTESTGEGEKRHVVVKPIFKK